MPWWVWVLIGFVLLGIEFSSAGLHIAFFGFGAIAVGVLVWLGIGGPLWVQLLLFTAISLASLLLFRKPLLRVLKLDRGPDRIDTLVGETAVTLDAIPAGARGRAELRGTAWSALNVATEALQPGARCVVERVDGLTIYIRPLPS
ncbi:MAG: NfeD family protein [Thermoanaerobaculia bacterium]